MKGGPTLITKKGRHLTEVLQFCQSPFSVRRCCSAAPWRPAIALANSATPLYGGGLPAAFSGLAAVRQDKVLEAGRRVLPVQQSLPLTNSRENNTREFHLGRHSGPAAPALDDQRRYSQHLDSDVPRCPSFGPPLEAPPVRRSGRAGLKI